MNSISEDIRSCGAQESAGGGGGRKPSPFSPNNRSGGAEYPFPGLSATKHPRKRIREKDRKGLILNSGKPFLFPLQNSLLPTPPLTCNCRQDIDVAGKGKEKCTCKARMGNKERGLRGKVAWMATAVG